MTKYTSDSSNFGADGPFFRIIREGLEGLVDGEDYFDLLADDVVFEYVISVPGYPRRVAGRQNIIDLYRGYGDFMTVHSADNLRVYRDPEASVVVLEYEVHGESVQTGRPYSNRFASDHYRQGPQGDALAGLPRPRRRVRRRGLARYPRLSITAEFTPLMPTEGETAGRAPVTARRCIRTGSVGVPRQHDRRGWT